LSGEREQVLVSVVTCHDLDADGQSIVDVDWGGEDGLAGETERQRKRASIGWGRLTVRPGRFP
jgi:hypothetical protein